jgi:hypothetical protein
VGARDGLRGPVHRVHAARRAARMGAREGGPRRSDPRRDRRHVSAGRRRARRRAGAWLSVRRRGAGSDRRDRERDRAVLRHLQPAPADGRGSVPHVPVRA